MGRMETGVMMKTGLSITSAIIKGVSNPAIMPSTRKALQESKIPLALCLVCKGPHYQRFFAKS